MSSGISAHANAIILKNKLMNPAQPNNPLHGITLEKILNELVTHYGWVGLGQQIDIRCFKNDPCIASSLKLLRRTPWAREQVEKLYSSTMFKK